MKDLQPQARVVVAEPQIRKFYLVVWQTGSKIAPEGSWLRQNQNCNVYLILSGANCVTSLLRKQRVLKNYIINEASPPIIFVPVWHHSTGHIIPANPMSTKIWRRQGNLCIV